MQANATVSEQQNFSNSMRKLARDIIADPLDCAQSALHTEHIFIFVPSQIKILKTQQYLAVNVFERLLDADRAVTSHILGEQKSRFYDLLEPHYKHGSYIPHQVTFVDVPEYDIADLRIPTTFKTENISTIWAI